MSNPIVAPAVQGPAKFNDYISRLGVSTFLSAEDARTYGANLTELVGSYIQVQDDKTAIRLGRPDAIPRATVLELKDKIHFKEEITDSTSIAATLPWLSLAFKKEMKTSIMIQDIASVVGTSDPATIRQHFPVGVPEEGKPVWFITGATVTVINATLYAERRFEGSTIIQIGGNKIFLRNVLENAWIVSINKVRAVPPAQVALHDDDLSDLIAGNVVRLLPAAA